MGEYIDCTPPSTSSRPRRPLEILDWIKAHDLNVDRGRGKLSYLGKVEEWVAVDDRPLLSEPGGNPGLVGHFVQTNSSEGLTAQRAQMAKAILVQTSSSGPSVHARGGEQCR